MEVKRCPWAKDELDIIYHDTQWGKPVHDDHLLFEMLILEGMQAGLSWSLILKRREAMRKAFDNFDPEIIALYTDEKKQDLLKNPNIIRNRAKINCLVRNAALFLKVQQEFGTFDAYIWKFVNHKPVINQWETTEQVPAEDAVSQAMSKDLYKRGFRFVGPVICYSYMQATGMVNDHLTWCSFRHA